MTRKHVHLELAIGIVAIDHEWQSYNYKLERTSLKMFLWMEDP
jgi:hypothetical protein